MKFEDLLPEGKKLHELTDDEINEIIQNASRDDLEKMEVGTRKSIRTTKSVKSIESERKKQEALNKILLSGMAQA